MKEKLINLQRFTEGAEEGQIAATTSSEENLIVATDIEPGISIDIATNFTENLGTLTKLLGITDLQPMANGTVAKIYKAAAGALAEQVGEGEDIKLTNVKRTLVKTIELTLKKFRKQTSAEAIQRVGQNRAVNETDGVLVSAIQKDIKKAFLDNLATGTGTATGKTLQAALADVWGKLQTKFEDIDATPIYFVSSADIADYLGTATVITQTAFGFTYIEGFLGLGDVIVVPSLKAGTVYGTAKENLRGLYVPATGGDVANAFGLTGDQTGLIGATHSVNTRNATVETLYLTGVVFYPELADGVFKGTITAE